MEHGVELHKTHWVPGRELIRRGVDGLSRVVDVNDWEVNEATWSRIREWSSELQVDRFASGKNARLERWNSRFHEPGVEAVDALMQDWRGVSNYACPPLCLMSQVVELVRSQQAATTLVVPVWKNQAWWPLLGLVQSHG